VQIIRLVAIEKSNKVSTPAVPPGLLAEGAKKPPVAPKKSVLLSPEPGGAKFGCEDNDSRTTDSVRNQSFLLIQNLNAVDFLL
jgi:hypothetical protein